MEEFDRDQSFEQRCPLCGGDNNCAMAGSSQRTCWCSSVTVDPKLLEELPESSGGKACLCRECCTAGTVESAR